MRKMYSLLLSAAVATSILVGSFSNLSAQWAPTSFPKPSAWDICQTSQGDLIVASSDFYNYQGLYISKDEGETWGECTAANRSYTAHAILGDYIFFGGVDGYIARSADGGNSWDEISIQHLFPEVEFYDDPIYAMVFHNDRLYVSILYWGIAYSDDMGDTWTLTDYESLQDADEPDNGGQWTYSFSSFKGSLYAIGAFGIWQYDESADHWTKVDDLWYCGDSFVLDGALYVIHNAYGLPQGIRYTTDMVNWAIVPMPENISTSIRVVRPYHGALFLGHTSDGIFYTTDMGESWIDFSDGFSGELLGENYFVFDTPMNFAFTDNYVVAPVFTLAEEAIGVYRAPIPDELITNGVLDNLALSNPMVVYPNPFTNLINIAIPEGMVGDLDVQLMDITGRILISQKVAAQSGIIPLETSSLTKGMYVISIQQGGSKFSRTVVK